MKQKEVIELRKWCVQAAVELLSMYAKLSPKTEDVITAAKAIETYVLGTKE